MNRRNIVAGLLAGSLIVGGGGFWLGRTAIKSPRDVASIDAPPEASRIVAEVEFRALSSVIRTRGDVRFGSPKPVVLASSALRPTNLLVTVAPEKQRVLAEGDRALEVGDRPVFALAGAVPMYRDLHPGDSGDDVRQLEEALVRLGFSSGAVDGTYDESTGRAVNAWYKKSGFEPFGLTDDQRARLKSARDDAARAGDAVLSLERTTNGASPDKIVSADEQLRSARDKVATTSDDGAKAVSAAQLTVQERQNALDVATSNQVTASVAVTKARREAGDTIGTDQAQANLQKAKDAVTEASSTVARNVAGFNDAVRVVDNTVKNVADANASLQDAQKALATAQDDLVKARSKVVTTVVGSPIVITDVDATATQVKAAENVVTSATAGVRTAEAGVRSTQDSLAKAQSAVVDSQGQVGKAQTLEIEAKTAVQIAQKQIDAAQQTVADKSPLVADAEAKQRQADAQVVQAQALLDSAAVAVKTANRNADAANRSALGQVKVAEAAKRELLRPKDAALLADQLSSAKAVKARADIELAKLEEKSGFVVPANELLFFPKFPVRIDDTKLERGDPITGASLMTVTNSRLALDSDIDTADVPSFKKGSEVDIQDQELQIGLKGTVTDIAARPGTKGVDASRTYVEISIDEKTVRSLRDGQSAPIGFDITTLNGRNVQVSIQVKTTGKAVLVVPVSALRSGPDGKTYVDVQDKDDPKIALRSVVVLTGLKDGAVIQVTPVDGDLKTGMQVAVGAAGSGLSAPVGDGSSSDAIAANSSTADTSLTPSS